MKITLKQRKTNMQKICLDKHSPHCTSCFTSSSPHESGTQIPTKYCVAPWNSRKKYIRFFSITYYASVIKVFIGIHLLQEHLAVLCREAGADGRATLLRRTRLVHVTVFNTAAHLSKGVKHFLKRERNIVPYFFHGNDKPFWVRHSSALICK